MKADTIPKSDKNAIMPYQDMLEQVPCNLCGRDDFTVVYPARYERASTSNLAEKFRSSGDEILVDQLVRCKDCGLQYLNPRLRQDLILEGYSAGTDEKFVSQATARERTFGKCLDLVEKYVPTKGRLLDIGAAGGSFLCVAKRRGWQISGCEPNRWLCGWASTHYGIEIQPGTVFDLRESNHQSFDAITLWDVLEHTPDPKAVLTECQRLLKTNGLLVVNYPDIGSWISRLMGRKWVFLLSVHLYYFNRPTIRKMLESTGFSPLKLQPHIQTLELGYILDRMKPYLPWFYPVSSKLVKLLHLEHVQIPYWIGQTLVIARRNG